MMPCIINPKQRRVSNMWVYKAEEKEAGPLAEPGTGATTNYFVGYYDPSGEFQSIGAFDSEKEARIAVSHLNGGLPYHWQKDVQEILEDICAALDKLNVLLRENLR